MDDYREEARLFPSRHRQARCRRIRGRRLQEFLYILNLFRNGDDDALLSALFYTLNEREFLSSGSTDKSLGASYLRIYYLQGVFSAPASRLQRGQYMFS